jgi:hypothetical protein
MDEIWKRVPLDLIPPHIEVSNFGRVRSLPYKTNHKDRKPYQRGNIIRKVREYGALTLRCTDGKNHDFSLAYLVLHAFKGPPAYKSFARRISKRRMAHPYHIDNLHWVEDLRSIECEQAEERQRAASLSVTHAFNSLNG